MEDYVLLMKSMKGDDNVTFIGSTLWTDFDLEGTQFQSSAKARRCIGDFSVIKNGDRKFSPQDAINKFEYSKEYIRQECNKITNGPKVVITHFLPSPKSISPRFKYSFSQSLFLF